MPVIAYILAIGFAAMAGWYKDKYHKLDKSIPDNIKDIYYRK